MRQNDELMWAPFVRSGEAFCWIDVNKKIRDPIKFDDFKLLNEAAGWGNDFNEGLSLNWTFHSFSIVPAEGAKATPTIGLQRKRYQTISISFRFSSSHRIFDSSYFFFTAPHSLIGQLMI